MSVPTGKTSPEETAAADDSGAALARRRSGLRATVADMVRSLLVIVGIVAVIVLLVPRPNSVPRAVVDLPSAVAAARTELGFDPEVAVPAGWTVTSTVTRQDSGDLLTWSVNYLTDRGTYVGLLQAPGWNARWQSSLSQGGTPRGSVVIDGRQWSIYANDDKQVTSLLLREPNRSILVLAKVGGEADARTLVDSLRSGS